jgi:hypothetical protein
MRLAALAGGGCFAHRGDLGRVDQHDRVARRELDGQLVDIAVLAAEAGRQRQRHRPDARIDRAAEQGGEIRPGFGDQRKAISRAQAVGDEAAGGGQRVLAQLAERVGTGQLAARIVEIKATDALRGIVQRVAEGGEIGQAAGQGAGVRRGDGAGFRFLGGVIASAEIPDGRLLLREQGGVSHGFVFPLFWCEPAAR